MSMINFVNMSTSLFCVGSAEIQIFILIHEAIGFLYPSSLIIYCLLTKNRDGTKSFKFAFVCFLGVSI